MPGDGWSTAPMWGEWLKLTRLQWSGRVAFESEIDKWSNRFIVGKENVSINIKDCGGNYETRLENHITALSDTSLFCSLIFLRSYALMENHCKLIKFIVDNKMWNAIKEGVSEDERDLIDSIELKNGIEIWATDLIEQTGQSWDRVYQGKVGLVEVSVIRNALMHGYTNASKHLIKKAKNRNSTIPFDEGDTLNLNFETLHEYRGRIRSLCRILGDGVVHFDRGTHKSLKSQSPHQS